VAEGVLGAVVRDRELCLHKALVADHGAVDASEEWQGGNHGWCELGPQLWMLEMTCCTDFSSNTSDFADVVEDAEVLVEFDTGAIGGVGIGVRCCE
jgi:hypothetical protein